MKPFILFLLSIFCVSLFSQITSVKYELVYNKKEKTTDVYLVILAGETNPEVVPHRIQFNSQVGIVVPKGTPVDILKTYHPLQNNVNKNSVTPTIWESINPLLAPPAAKKKDFYSIRPKMHPTSFYNEMKTGDRIKLFTIGTQNKNCKKVRLYDEKKDPPVGNPGMYGRNFTQAFCIGGAKQICIN